MSIISACSSTKEPAVIQDIEGIHRADSNHVWLSHEHLLVDFSGAEKINSDSWDHDSVIKVMEPYLKELKVFNVKYFVDATPAYLGRDPVLLEKISDRTGIRIITNTGFYGARSNIFVPEFAEEMSAEELADIWIGEYNKGIDGTKIKPGFIKIGVDARDPLDPMHQKLVKAAALTHLETGLTIASHTGKAVGLWPQLEILKEHGVSPNAFIWVHAQVEDDFDNYLKAAGEGCWISFDGLGREINKHADRILFAKENGFLNRVLLSHDAGWYDPAKKVQDIVPFTNIFKKLKPELKANRFTDAEFNQLVTTNPANAFGIDIRKYSSE